MTAHPQPPPEAELIRHRREAPPNMSRRKAAELAGMSESRWRQLEAGGYWHRKRWEAEIAPDQTLARMARAVGVTPQELSAAGRSGAAAELAAMPAAAADLAGAGQIDILISMNRQLLDNMADMSRRLEHLEGRNRGKEDNDEEDRRNAI